MGCRGLIQSPSNRIYRFYRVDRFYHFPLIILCARTEWPLQAAHGIAEGPLQAALGVAEGPLQAAVRICFGPILILAKTLAATSISIRPFILRFNPFAHSKPIHPIYHYYRFCPIKVHPVDLSLRSLLSLISLSQTDPLQIPSGCWRICKCKRLRRTTKIVGRRIAQAEAMSSAGKHRGLFFARPNCPSGMGARKTTGGEGHGRGALRSVLPQTASSNAANPKRLPPIAERAPFDRHPHAQRTRN